MYDEYAKACTRLAFYVAGRKTMSCFFKLQVTRKPEDGRHVTECSMVMRGGLSPQCTTTPAGIL